MAWLASRARATHVNPFCTPEEAEAVVELAQEFGDFHQQNDVGAVLVNGTGIGEGIPTAECPADGKPPHLGWVLNNDQDEWILPRRYDAMVGGQHTNNWNRPRDVRNPTGFRETYAYGDAHSLEFFHPKAQAVEQLLTEKFTPLALRIYPDKPIVECNVVYCNVLIPGQEVGMHSDVPEFRGVNRLTAPNWLLGVMQHSGLFEEYRVHGVTCVSYYQDTQEGELAAYTQGPDKPGQVYPARFASCTIFDADSTFHQADRVSQRLEHVPVTPRGTTLRFAGGEGAQREWSLHAAEGQEVGRFFWRDMRMSVSWKAHCFSSPEAQELYHSGEGSLTVPAILRVFAEDLREKGVALPDSVPDGMSRDEAKSFAELLCLTYARYPTAATCQETWREYPGASYHTLPAEPQEEAAEAFPVDWGAGQQGQSKL